MPKFDIQQFAIERPATTFITIILAVVAIVILWSAGVKLIVAATGISAYWWIIGSMALAVSQVSEDTFWDKYPRTFMTVMVALVVMPVIAGIITLF